MKEAEEKKPGLTAAKVIVAFFLILGTLGVIAWQLCNLNIKNSTQIILNRERDIQQTWMDKSLDKIRVWRNEIVEQARYLSTSEMFRLFVMDTRGYSPKDMEELGEPDALHSPDEDTRGMAEQFIYIRDLLKDFTKRRAWTDARILRVDGTQVIAGEFALPLTEEQKSLAIAAGDSGKPSFGPIRRGQDGLLMDMADPLFEVLGAKEQKPIAVLLLSIPLDAPLTNFLSSNSEQHLTILPRILDKNGERVNVAFLSGDGLKFEETSNPPENMEGFTFGLHKGVLDGDDFYSMGAYPTVLKWLLVLETPAKEVNAIIDEQKTQIYMMGGLATLGLALLIAFFWARHTSHAEKERAEKLARLNLVIRRQKQILSCINKSNLDGLLLVDSIGRIEVCNPAFLKIARDEPSSHDAKALGYALESNESEEEPAAKLTLHELFPDKTGTKLAHDMAVVRENGKSATVEITIPTKLPDGKEEDRLYRVTIYPFVDDTDVTKPKIGGSLAIFTDITQFRRNKLINDARQTALVSALGRAIESVDENLVGHSDKMARVATRLGEELDMDKRQQETLQLAARLSQIGKIFVPREILTKKGKLTPEELEEAKRAPEYADKVLNDLHFDLPIRETIREMGTSCADTDNPDAISLCGKALAVINAFIAMTSARAWRSDGGLDPQKAIALLLADARFDSAVVEALGRIPSADLAKIIDGK